MIRKTWKLLYDQKTNDSIKFIEDTFTSSEELKRENAEKLVSEIANTMLSYDFQVEVYNDLKNKVNKVDLLKMKHNLFYFREWLHKYHGNILPFSENIEIGSINDEPSSLIP